MRTSIPEKLLKIAAEIAVRGNANLTRLTILKKWFGHAGKTASVRHLGGESGHLGQGQNRG